MGIASARHNPRIRIYSRPPNEKFQLSANGFSPTIEPKKGRIVSGDRK
jgi:hypothetical protein